MSQVFPSLALQYEPFLFAVVCDEANGMQLTLVSAIARTGVDPWGEAARIARLPRERAREVLIALIPPGLDAEHPAAQATVDRLIALLPGRGARGGEESVKSAVRQSGASPSPIPWPNLAPGAVASKAIVTVVVLCLCLMLAIAFSRHSNPGTDARGAAQPAEHADPSGK